MREIYVKMYCVHRTCEILTPFQNILPIALLLNEMSRNKNKIRMKE